MSRIFRNALQRIALAAILAATLAAAGCGGTDRRAVPPMPQEKTVAPPPGSLMLDANTYAGDALSAILLQRMDSGRILCTAMVRMDNLEETSSFGRMAMQQVASRVAQHGFNVSDVRLAEALTMNGSGEFMLTRNAARIMEQEFNAHAVLVGVYSQAGNKIFVSTRILRLSDNAILAAYEYYLPLSGDVAHMLRAGAESSGAGSVSSGAGDGLWAKYAARGRARFAEERVAGNTPLSSSGTTRTVQAAGASTRMTPYGEEFVDRGGGKWIDPNAAPAPMKKGR